MNVQQFESVAPDDWWKGESSLKNGVPWLTPSAVASLESLSNPEGIVLEFGAGGSTIWFAKHFGYVHSFETNPVWKQRVENRLKAENLKNAIVEPMNRLNIFEHSMFPGRINLVLVDSQGSRNDRTMLCRKTIPWLAPKGVIVLDNYGRYKLDFLNDDEWEIALHDEPHWDGKGTLIATQKKL